MSCLVGSRSSRSLRVCDTPVIYCTFIFLVTPFLLLTSSSLSSGEGREKKGVFSTLPVSFFCPSRPSTLKGVFRVHSERSRRPGSWKRRGKVGESFHSSVVYYSCVYYVPLTLYGYWLAFKGGTSGTKSAPNRR